MPERNSTRNDQPDRRRFPRPPLWLNLLLLVVALATIVYARYQRTEVERRTAALLAPSPANPAELIRLREQLAGMDLTKAELAKRLDGERALLSGLSADRFYVAIDTAKKRFYLRYGNDVVRDGPAEIGGPLTVTSDGKTWTFTPVRGSFGVVSKETGYTWDVPEWVYAARHQAAPAEPESIPNGLGKYVVVLRDDYIIHSPPPPNSPLAGRPKPGSIMIPEKDLEAIWPRISNQTRVYIF